LESFPLVVLKLRELGLVVIVQELAGDPEVLWMVAVKDPLPAGAVTV